MIILPANTLSSGGYNVANSLRFENSSSEQLTRSIGSSPTNTKKGTFSYWIKRTKLSTNDVIVSNEVGSSSERAYISFNTSDYWRTVDENGIVLATNAVFRDVSAWTNFVLTLDSTLGTETDRVKLYINGTRYTDFQSSSYFNNGFPNQDIDFDLFTGGQTNKHHIGNIHGGSSYLDGYLAEVCYCDGQTLDASSFGEFDEDRPTIWKPKDVSGLTFGNNGYYLDFEDSSALGNDAAGSNNFGTVTNLAATDQATDTCTNNFATMNPLDNYYGAQTYSEGNLQINSPSGNASAPHSTFGVSSGRWYVEAKLDSAGSNQTLIGISSNQATQTDYHTGRGATSYGMYSNGGKIYNNNDSGTSYGSGYSAGNIIGIYLDLEDNKLYYSVNGTLQNSGTGHTIAAASTTELGFYFFSGMQWDNAQSCQWSFNFGSPTYANSSSNTDDNGYGDFEYSPNITGDGSAKKFYALNSKNLAEYG